MKVKTATLISTMSTLIGATIFLFVVGVLLVKMGQDQKAYEEKRDNFIVQVNDQLCISNCVNELSKNSESQFLGGAHSSINSTLDVVNHCTAMFAGNCFAGGDNRVYSPYHNNYIYIDGVVFEFGMRVSKE